MVEQAGNLDDAPIIALAVRDPAVRLFAIFSRFEFALKEAGYIQVGPGQSAQADWARFGQAPGAAAAFDRVRESKGAQILFEAPPRQQVTDGVHLEWRDRAPPTDAASLVLAIKRVRNNLFHGGKQSSDPDRDDQLCQAAEVGLGVLLTIDGDVRHAYLGMY